MFGLVLTAAGVWALATPLFTGPDEVSQVRRAAAVARGQLVGERTGPDPVLLMRVEVPGLYGAPAEQQWLCHLGPLVDGAPQQAMVLPKPDCPDLSAVDAAPVEADTVQYRGQPFYYALVGAPTLADQGRAGAYAMRMVGAALTTAFIASAAATLTLAPRPSVAGVGLLVCITPAVVYLAGSTNPSSVEIAAALSAWAVVAVLAGTAKLSTVHGHVDAGDGDGDGEGDGKGDRAGEGEGAGDGEANAKSVPVGGSGAPDAASILVTRTHNKIAPAGGAGAPVPESPGRLGLDEETVASLVRRVGVALVVLSLGRGLGPAFAAAVVAIGGVVLGRARVMSLLGRTDLRRWAAAVAVSVTMSGLWLAHIGRAYPLPDRPGSGWARALEWVPWYLHQMVGVFGTNDSAVSWWAVILWGSVSIAVVVAGLATLVRQGRNRVAVTAAGTLVAGVAMNVTAEGLSLPPIGFFWQGRYSLPLLVGGVILATATAGSPEGSTANRRPRFDLFLAVAAIAAVTAVHVHALVVVTGHLDRSGATGRGAAATLLAGAIVALGRTTALPSPSIPSPTTGDPGSTERR
ncbi:MAG: DUF2142 domain-containing protein [Microthrixaceae bacterium]|nr:DUF2142 domain-containing protein [Microthrixaceae bacterium]